MEQGNGTVPVRVSNAAFKVTVYLKRGEAAMIVIADWSESAESEYVQQVSFSYDWDMLGLDPATAQLHLPVVAPFQLPHPSDPASLMKAGQVVPTRREM